MSATLRDVDSGDIRSEISLLESEVADFNRMIADCQTRATGFRSEVGRRNQRLNELKQELDRRNRPAIEPRVSEHALLRYIERVLGIDIEACRASILTENVVAAIKAGASAVNINGIKFVVSGATIVTTLEPGQRLKRSTTRGLVVDAATAIAEGLAEHEEMAEDLP